MSTLLETAAKLSDPDELERLYAAEDIGYLNEPGGVDPLLARLAVEPSPRVREAIFQALIRIEGDAPIKGAVSLLSSDSPSIRNEAVGLLRRKGEPAIPYLLPVMRDGNKNHRKLVLDVLAGIPGGNSDDLYTAALADSDLNVLITAVENVGRLRLGQYRHSIEALLDTHEDPMLSAACLEALGGIAHPESLDVIRRRFPAPATLPEYLLIPYLRACETLGAPGDFPQLGSLLASGRPAIRPAALAAMLAIATRHGAPPLEAPLLSTLRDILTDGPGPNCQYQATQLLGLWSDHHEAAALLIRSLRSPESLVRWAAAEALRDPGHAGTTALPTRKEFQ